MNRIARLAAASLILGLVAACAAAQEKPFDFFSRGPYADGVPRPEQILGYAIGTRHTYHYQMESYLAALAASPASAGRIKLEQYGVSNEGRKLWLVFISAPENIARLEEIRQRVARLRDPRSTSESDARQIASSTPAFAWMNYANDGNESAAFETGLQAAYQLVAGEDATTRQIRERVITILNPAHNPESHDRFVAWFNAVVHGPRGTADPNAVEHDSDWLMDSNDNHFHMDLNRDAFALTQLETQAIVRQIQRWNPQVFVDHHGNPPIFFFPPVAIPVNPNFGEIYKRGETLYGRAIAAEFDKYGWSYMNREIFDLFFPGYFDSYPVMNGAIGMTFETDGGGHQGLRLEREDKTISTLASGIAKHFTATMATLAATAANKDQRLVDYYLFRKTGMDEAEREPLKQIVLVPGADRGRLAAFLSLLLLHGVEIHRAPAAFSSPKAHSYTDDKTVTKQFPAGSFVIPLAQPQKRLIKTLLEPDAKLPEDFVKEVFARKERNEKLGRRAAKESYGFYDVTAWSLPLTFGLEAWWTEDRAATLERVEAAPAAAGGVEGGRATYAYVFRYDSNAAAHLLAQLFEEDFRATVFRSAIQIGAETYGPGSILLRVERNPASLHDRMEQLAREFGVSVRALHAAWTESGLSFGSSRVHELKAPRVAVATYPPTNGRAYGSLWFLFEKILGYSFTAIRTDALRNADLSRYDVLIFPDGGEGGYQELLGSAGISRIKQWIENGGVFIGIKGGAAFATRRNVEWTTARLVGREEPPATAAQPTPAPMQSGPAPMPSGAPGSQAAQSASIPSGPPEKEVDRTPGAILRAELNLAHFLTFGYDAQELVMHNSALIFKPSKEGTNVASYAKENLRVSGFVFPDTEKRLAGTPYLLDENVGRGHVILFADDPNFRLVWPRLTRLFLNAVFFAPSLR